MCQKPARLAMHWMEELAPPLANSRRTLRYSLSHVFNSNIGRQESRIAG